MKSKKYGNRILAIVSVGIFWMSGCSTTTVLPSKKDQQRIPVTGKLKASRHQLKNGLKIIIVRDQSSPTFSYQTWFDFGSASEEKGKTGLAHFFEHMMFKKTKNYESGEIRKTLEEEGAEGLNAATSRDYTVYYASFPSGNLELVAKLESERLQNLLVEDEEFQSEKEVVRNERRMRYENNPTGKIYQKIFSTSYSKEKEEYYRHPIIGYAEDLDRLSLKDARDFYKKFYTPNRATIVVVGDVSEEKVVSVIDKHYGHIPIGNTKTEEIRLNYEKQKTQTIKMPLQIENEKLSLAYRVPGAQHPDNSAIEVFEAILSDGKNSRLQRALVNTGMSTSVYSGSFQSRHPSLYIIATSLQKQKKAEKAQSIILRELQQLKETPVSLPELKRAKNIVLYAFYSRISSNAGLARFIGSYEVKTGNFEKGLEIYRNIESVSVKDVQRIATQYFFASNRTAIIGTPRKNQK